MKKIFLIAVICTVLVSCCIGCKTCPPPEIIYTPQPYPVPTYIPPPALELPAEPDIQVCSEVEDITERVQCTAVNILRIQRYAEELKITIDAHNAAIQEEE